MTRKPKYLSKTILFNGKQLTVYSLDGLTWSTRRTELLQIKERHDKEKVTLAELKGESEESQNKGESENAKEDDGKPVEIDADEADAENSETEGSKADSGRRDDELAERRKSISARDSKRKDKGEPPKKAEIKLRSVSPKKRDSAKPTKKTTKAKKKAA